MPRRAATDRADASRPDPPGYLEQSRRPLQILLFLAPLIVAYELALAFVLRDPDDGAGTITVAAHRAILRILVEMGFPPTAVLQLGGVLLVVLLLAWHVLRRDPWRVDGTVAVGMTAESILLALPLLAVALMLADAEIVLAATGTVPGVGAAGAAAAEAGAAAAAGTPPPKPDAAGGELGLIDALAISIGAGLYEELFFRWMLIAVLHTLLVDVGRLGDRTGTAIAVVASAAAFTVYHELTGPGGGIDAARAAFLAIAGLWFGVVYAVRGFGIVVGLHAAYDIAVVLKAGPEAVGVG